MTTLRAIGIAFALMMIPGGASARSYVGCFKDKPARDLPRAFISRGNMTINQCKAHCRSRGYRYAGAQFSKQCFCGNSFGRYGRVADHRCNMSCAGNSRQKCGASWHNSIYRVGGASATPPPPPAPQPQLAPPLARRGGYVGCFKDKPARDLPRAFISRGSMTINQCKAHCRSRGYRYAGAQFSKQCFCGNSVGRYGRVGDHRCNMSCAGNSRQKCGASWHNSVYRVRGVGATPPPPPAPQPQLAPPPARRGGYVGCFKDKPARDLPRAFISRGSMTINQCKVHCRSRGYRYAGAQFANQCFCGNSVGRYGRVGDHRCNMSCAGNRRQKCGASWHNSVYRVRGAGATPPPAPALARRGGYVGCFKDKPARDLPRAFISRGSMTINQCKAHCRSKGYRYAGAQFANQCFCGNSVGRYGRVGDHRCKMSCAGNSRQKCGAAWHNSVYRLR